MSQAGSTYPDDPRWLRVVDWNLGGSNAFKLWDMRKLTLVMAALVLATACTNSLSSRAPNRGPRRTPDPPDFGHGEITRTIGGESARVVLEIDPAQTAQGDRVTWTLHNEGKIDIGYGHAYLLHRPVGGSWKEVPNHIGFTLELLSLSPGESSKPEPVALYNKRGHHVPFELGIYRITIGDVSLGSGYPADESVDILALFRVLSK